jgi:hypothetical protein
MIAPHCTFEGQRAKLNIGRVAALGHMPGNGHPQPRKEAYMRRISWILGIGAALLVACGVESASTNSQQRTKVSDSSSTLSASNAPESELSDEPTDDAIALLTGTCNSGPRQGQSCSVNSDCGLFCVQGPRRNMFCFTNSDCGLFCVSGSRANTICTTSADCPGSFCAQASCAQSNCLGVH